MNKDQIKALLFKYEAGTCTEEEKALLETWFLQQYTEELPSLPEIESDLDEVWHNLNKYHGVRRTLWPRIAAAAAIIFCLSIGGYSLLHKHQPAPQLTKNQFKDILPGGERAILTLANGKKIVLNNAANGKLAEQSGIKITKSANGQIVYTVKNITAAHAAGLDFNTIETPVGGQYQIRLPDGTQVWLNAASLLRYPVLFSGNERKVELTGEAYFEVAHNKQMPFKVSNARQTVEVLGTHFNIMAYANEEAVKTTLLKGSIKVTSSNHASILIPGQQSQVTFSTVKVIDNADIDEAVAWKNGKIQLADSNIQTIMRQLSRWYNLDVHYEGSLGNISFGGSVSRSKNLSEVLKVLESTGDVHFKIDGREVTVMP